MEEKKELSVEEIKAQLEELGVDVDDKLKPEELAKLLTEKLAEKKEEKPAESEEEEASEEESEEEKKVEEKTEEEAKLRADEYIMLTNVKHSRKVYEKGAKVRLSKSKAELFVKQGFVEAK